MLFMYIESNNDLLKAERLYKQYRHLMYGEANKILQDASLAEDAVHQSFIKIINNLHKIDETNCRRTQNFMVIICVNTAKDIYNKRSYLNKKDYAVYDADEDIADTGNAPLDILVDKDSINHISNAIEALNPIYRDVILLKCAYGCSRIEIAELLGISEGAVKKRLERARKLLSHVLEKEGLK